MKNALLVKFLGTIGFCCCFAAGQCQGIMTTWVGNGVPGYTGDGGPAEQAELNQPFAVCFDPSGNLYIADQGNNAVRMVTPAGVITTVAGTGFSGSTGDNGPATNATFGSIEGLCADQSGNIYVSDQTNNEIRMLNTSTGMLTVLAGNGMPGFSGDNGPAANASLNGPQGLFYFQGNLFVADAANNAIRKINLATGIISTIAGSGRCGFSGDGGAAINASLNGPSSVCVNTDGYVYFADMLNYRIRVILPSGIIETIAGNGQEGYSGDGGLAVHAQIGTIDGLTIDPYGSLYLDDISCSSRKITAGTGRISTVAGSGFQSGYTGDGGAAVSELLQEPAGLCIDPATGTVVIADNGNNRVRRATQPGYFQTIAEPNPVVYPNPTTGTFYIKVQDDQKNAYAEIVDVSGHGVYSTMLSADITSVNISSLASGVYFVRIKLPSGKLFQQKITAVNN